MPRRRITAWPLPSSRRNPIHPGELRRHDRCRSGRRHDTPACLGEHSWWTILRAPGFYGVYPVRVRAGGVTRETDAVVSVLPRGFAAQPGFDEPQQVPEWWRRQAPAGAELTSVSTWGAGFFTHREPSLNRLLRVRFTLHCD
jgi:hypothetical protein